MLADMPTFLQFGATVKKFLSCCMIMQSSSEKTRERESSSFSGLAGADSTLCRWDRKILSPDPVAIFAQDHVAFREAGANSVFCFGRKRDESARATRRERETHKPHITQQCSPHQGAPNGSPLKHASICWDTNC